MRVTPKFSLTISIIALSALSTTACNPVKEGGGVLKETFNSDDPCSNNARNIGILAGGILGAVLGNKMGDGKGAVVLGAALGAGVGALIGNDIDSRRCELHKISQRYQVPISAEPISADTLGMSVENLEKRGKSKEEVVGLKVNLQDIGRQFESGSDQLLPEAKAYFTEIAKTYSSDYASGQDAKSRQQHEAMLKQKKILIVGHTDDTGSSNFNAELAEKRAKVVAELFASQGVSRSNLHFQGAGETQPIADNRTEAGRAQNRRAEIVELPDQQAFESYLTHRKPVIAYYRTESKTAFVKPKLGKSVVAASKKIPENKDKNAPSTVSSPLAVLTAAKQETLPPSPWHFNGTPLTQASASVNIGEVIPKKDMLAWVPIIGTAHADEKKMDSVYTSTCAADRPRTTRGVKSLATGKDITQETKDYLPGLYNTVWIGDAGTHKVALSGVAVSRDGGVPVKNPTLRFYPDSVISENSKPLASPSTQVNAYHGKEGVLYRVFITDNSAPVSCIDVVMPNKAPFEAKAGYLIYQDSNQDYATEFKAIKI